MRAHSFSFSKTFCLCCFDDTACGSSGAGKSARRPAPSAANKKSSPRGASTQHLAPRRNSEG